MSHLRTASSRRRGIHASTISSSRLRMDTHGGSRGNSRGHSPRHKEIDRVLKKTRNESGPQSNFWTKKSLETEEKDPYRSTRDRSRSNHNHSRTARDRSRSPKCRSRTPRGRSRTPTYNSQSLRNRSRDRRDLPRPRGQPSNPAAHLGRHGPRAPRSPPPERRTIANSHSSNRHRGHSSSKTRLPPSPPTPDQSSSPSAASIESCSNDSCSVCSPRRGSETKVRHHHSRSRSFSVPRSAAERVQSPMELAPSKRKKVATSLETRRTLVHSGGMSKRVARGMSQGETKRERPVTRRALEGNGSMHKISRSMHESGRGETGRVQEGGRSVDEQLMDREGHQQEGGRSRARTPRISRHSRARDAMSSASSDSESDSESASQSSDGDSAPRLPYSSSTLTLSERFGRMAQWSVDRREYDSVRMKITKDSHSSGKKVVIEGGASLSPPPSSIDGYRRGSYNSDGYNHPGAAFGQSMGVLHPSPMPEYGHSQYRLGRRDESPSGMQMGGGTAISAVIPEGTIGDWDDVHVRYRYYRDRGYFWDMGLEEYAKWEEWWAKYQEWLEMERYYEQVAQHREWAAAAAAATAASGWPTHVGRNYGRRSRGRSRDDQGIGDVIGDVRQGKGSMSSGGVWAGDAGGGGGGGRKRRR